MTNWTATLLKAHGFSLEDSLMATTIISVGVPAGLFFSSFVTDLGGRKIPIMCMLIILAVLGPIFGNMTQPLIPMAYAAYSFDGVFWIFSFLCFVPAVVIAIWGQRTGGKSLEEIA